MDVKEYFKRGKAVKWWNPIEDHKQKDVIKLVDPKRARTHILSPFTVPWTSYTKKEFLLFIKNSGIKVQLIREYGKPYAPSVYLALCVKT